MISVRNIGLEYKSSVIFAVLALILSLVTGFIAGIRWDVVLVRSVILMALFAGIGFGLCVIIRKFVPEVYLLLAGIAGTSREGDAGEADVNFPAAGAAEAADGEPAVPEAAGEIGAEGAVPLPEGEFSELDKEALAHYSTASGSSPVNTKSGKLGKHILEKEKLSKYEPKIMAQAVRTMMSKDRE